MRAKTFLMLALILSVIACGESDPQSQAKQAGERSSDPAIGDEENDKAKDLATALGAGSGGGTLIFDGTEVPIESALCYLDGALDVGTVGGGYRIVISGAADRPSVSIVAKSVQWVPKQYPPNPIGISGLHLSYPENTYRNNRDDQKVQASFEIDCPPA